MGRNSAGPSRIISSEILVVTNARGNSSRSLSVGAYMKHEEFDLSSRGAVEISADARRPVRPKTSRSFRCAERGNRDVVRLEPRRNAWSFAAMNAARRGHWAAGAA